MNILAFESSCDETAAAVVRDGRTVLSDVIASQADMHAVYGGVVPEIASRKHVEAIAGLADQALARAGLTRADIDAVAVTYAPGLIGALLVGVNFAKAAAYGLGVPLIPVHHVRGHIAANYITQKYNWDKVVDQTLALYQGKDPSDEGAPGGAGWGRAHHDHQEASQ